MTLLEKLREKLGTELMSQVEDAVGDDFDWDFVPRSRLNKVIGQRNALSIKVQNLTEAAAAEDDDEDPDTKGAGKDAKGDKKKKDDGVDIEAIKSQHATELQNVAKRYAVLDYLRAQGARDPKLVLSMLDMDKITLDESETLQGIEDQVAATKESHDYLFQTAGDGVSGGTGKDSGSDEGNETDPFEAVIASYSK